MVATLMMFANNTLIMDDEMGKIYHLSDYRSRATESGEVEAGISPLTFVLEDNAVKAFTTVAIRDGITPKDLMTRALNWVIEDSELRSEGYDGPIYKRPKQTLGKLGGWLTRMGLIDSEQIKVNLDRHTPPVQT